MTDIAAAPQGTTDCQPTVKNMPTHSACSLQPRLPVGRNSKPPRKWAQLRSGFEESLVMRSRSDGGIVLVCVWDLYLNGAIYLQEMILTRSEKRDVGINCMSYHPAPPWASGCAVIYILNFYSYSWIAYTLIAFESCPDPAASPWPYIYSVLYLAVLSECQLLRSCTHAANAFHALYVHWLQFVSPLSQTILCFLQRSRPKTQSAEIFSVQTHGRSFFEPVTTEMTYWFKPYRVHSAFGWGAEWPG